MNDRVRVAEAADGGLVVMGAWCGHCNQEAMPDREGLCLYCGSKIVDEDTLSASEMRQQIAERAAA